MERKDSRPLSQPRQDLENVDLPFGINVRKIFYNASPAILYEQAIAKESGSYISSTGALIVCSGAKTGRSPTDKRIVDEPESTEHIWWGPVNFKMTERSYRVNRERAIDYLNLQDCLYVVDAFAGWDPKYRISIRVITTRAYHALFMQDMLVMPTAEEIKSFRPEFIIYNAGCFPANRYTECVTSQTTVAINFARGEMVILGTQYAGEMKKGILTLMMYAMPRIQQLPLHSSCNIGPSNDVTLFFGLSGTGKTTLSADPRRFLIGDDEHVWTDHGVFNVEGGCYAKCKDLSEAAEPDIFRAVRFGSVLENVVFDMDERVVDYTDCSVTENTRCAYPLNYIPNAVIPAMTDIHPSNIILLTCDAFGVLPPLSKLTTEQVMYHFISGYTSKVAGTEEGIYQPTATFSSCFGAPFLAMHPMVYAKMLAKKLKEHAADAWLVNTGWTGGGYGVGERIPLRYTRLMIDSIHAGILKNAKYQTMEVLNLAVPVEVPGVPTDLLFPDKSWKDPEAYRSARLKLVGLFNENFKQYSDNTTPEVLSGGPSV